jgi:hypothetical protein
MLRYIEYIEMPDSEFLHNAYIDITNGLDTTTIVKLVHIWNENVMKGADA